MLKYYSSNPEVALQEILNKSNLVALKQIATTAKKFWFKKCTFFPWMDSMSLLHYAAMSGQIQLFSEMLL